MIHYIYIYNVEQKREQKTLLPLYTKTIKV